MMSPNAHNCLTSPPKACAFDFRIIILFIVIIIKYSLYSRAVGGASG